MNLQQLQQFVTLSEILNFNRAARALNMAQPPLSVSIRKLEAELGAPLFTRNQRHVALTAAGSAALSNARLALFHAAQVKEVVMASMAGARGQLRLGIIGTATFSLLPLIIPAFRERYPDVDLSVMESSTTEILQYLQDDRLDIGIVRTPILDPAPVQLDILMLDSFAAVVSATSRFARKQSVRLAELKNERFIGYDRNKGRYLHAIMMLSCQRAGFQPDIVQEMLQIQAHIALVGSGMGVALIPRAACRDTFDKVRYLTIEDAEPDIGMAMALRSGPQIRTAANFRELVLEMRDRELFSTSTHGKASLGGPGRAAPL